MKIRPFLSLILMVGLAGIIFYQDSGNRLAVPVTAQIGGGCGSFTAADNSCGDVYSCGSGYYTSTAAFYNGPGINGQEPRDVNCEGTDCGNVQGVSTAYYNGYCCDQDNDGYASTACGGTDCRDDNFNINPGKAEVCGDNIDNNCSGQIDENCSTGGGGGPPSGGGNGCGVPTNGPNNYGCPYISPVLLDINGDGFAMTDYYQGVPFDISGRGTTTQISWTTAGTDDAWVVLDRNHNGKIDDGTEMFGDASAQPIVPAAQRNGFSSLAVFDQSQNGGNGDGKINKQDRIYNDLRLWRDNNHNGISESNEMFKLKDLDVRAIFLDYRESRRTDQYGNRFRFKAKVRDSRDADVGKFAWDVFLLINPPDQNNNTP